MHKKSLLSFHVDEDEEETDFQVKKSKESRKFKKMRQAPNLFASSSQNEVGSNKLAFVEFGGEYSADKLASLREVQKFKMKKPQEVEEKVDNAICETLTQITEEIELSGEEAEKFMENLENSLDIQSQIPNKNNLNTDFIPFNESDNNNNLSSSLQLLSNKKNEKKSKRLYTTLQESENRTLEYSNNNEEDENNEWENEIIKRGVINSSKNSTKTILLEKNFDLNSKSILKKESISQYSNLNSIINTTSSKSKQNKKNNNSIDILDMIENIQLSIDKIKFNVNNNEKNIEKIKNNEVKTKNELKNIRESCENDVKKLNIIKVTKFFF
jgi:hypothetical protein